MAWNLLRKTSSGIHDVTTLLGLSSGQALLEVRDGLVWLDFLAAQWEESGGSVTLTATGLASVAPEVPRSSVNSSLISGAGTLRRAQVNAYGQARLFSLAAGDVVNGAMSWPMSRPMPATFPGVKL